jgi:hypothetical protein
MKTGPDTLETVEQITVRLDALELRVTALEYRRETLAEAVPAVPAAVEAMRPAAAGAAEGSGWFGAFPVVGAALLGLAGAYLLRAVSSAEIVPRAIVAAVAAIYAAGWMTAAERVRGRRFAAAVYASTSLLILAPMLWEMTVLFRAMSGTAAAGILGGFVALLLALKARAREEAEFGFAFAGLAATALMLSIGTHRMAEFSALILAMYALAESRRAAPWLAAALAILADLAVWTIIFLYRLPAGERTDYPALPGWLVIVISAAVFGVAAWGVAGRALRKSESVPVFAAAQAMAAFGILLCGIVWMMPEHGVTAVGEMCLALAPACAWAGYGPLREAERRNFHLFSLWTVALIAGGIWLLTPAAIASVLLVFAGMALLLLAQISRIASLNWQGLVLLVAGAFVSGLMMYGFNVLAGTVPGAPDWTILLVAALLVAGYIALQEVSGEGAGKQIAHLVPAVLVTFCTAVLGTRALAAAASVAMTLDVFHIALLRTVVLCAIAVLLAFGGARLRRPQMVRVAYCALAFVTAKLLFEDLRHGHMAFIAGSLCLVAVTMMAVPRLGSAGSRE